MCDHGCHCCFKEVANVYAAEKIRRIAEQYFIDTVRDLLKILADDVEEGRI